MTTVKQSQLWASLLLDTTNHDYSRQTAFTLTEISAALRV